MTKMNLCGFEVGDKTPFFLIAGTCVIESEQMAMDTAAQLKEICEGLGIQLIYKSSFDKANRSSHASYRGPGIDVGLKILQKVKQELHIPVLTDVHDGTPLDEVAEVVSVLQTPAFLCRQTEFIQRVAATGLPVNIKKGQFLAPWDMKHVVEKAKATGKKRKGQIKINEFQIVIKEAEISEYQNKERIKHLCQLIFPNISGPPSTSSYV